MAKQSFPPFHPRSTVMPAALSTDEFAKLFPAESDFIERKTGVGQHPIAKAITALSNTEGGVILIGVRDDGSVAGRGITDGVENAIHQAALTVHDPGRYRIHELAIDGTPVTVVSVARREQGFAQTADGQVLVRRGARSVPLLGSELLAFVTSRALVRFDETDSGVPLRAADNELLDELRRIFRWRSGSLEDRLINHRLAVRNGSPRLTVAGALLLLREPRTSLGKSYVEVLRFPDDGVNYDRRVEFAGPVQEQVEDVTAFVRDELGTDLIVSGARRLELPKIPEVVLREAIANAVGHRSYEELGRSVRVEIRPDQITVISPGGLPEPVTEENIRETQSARNIHVLRALRRFRLAEDAGRGVDVMQDQMAEALLDPPQFEDRGHSVAVTLPIRGPISPQERAWIIEVERRGVINVSDRIPLIHAARGEALTNARVRELLGVDSRDARQSLRRLKDAGFLEQFGQRGGAVYLLARAVEAPAAFRLSPSELETFILDLATEGELTNAKVRTETGLDRVEAFRILDRLVQEGHLERRGERRGAHYVLTRPRPVAS
jgi:ATP-dependent DNA helicase RecG